MHYCMYYTQINSFFSCSLILEYRCIALIFKLHEPPYPQTLHISYAFFLLLSFIWQVTYEPATPSPNPTSIEIYDLSSKGP